ncbi:MAG TPA: hypothetical protein VGE13_00055 [Candidatus Saccharimonadales bacterium]
MTMKEEVSKKRVRKQPMNRWSAWGIILAIFMAMNLGLYAASGLIVHPTEAHRKVATEYSELSTKAWEQEDVMKAFENPKLKALESSPEMAYSNMAMMATTLVQIVVWVAFVGVAFNYLRKNRIGKVQAMAVALIDAIGTVVLMIPLLLLSPYFGYPESSMMIPGIDPIIGTLIAMPFAFIFSILITYLVARIFQWRYDRKYNFAVE